MIYKHVGAHTLVLDHRVDGRTVEPGETVTGDEMTPEQRDFFTQIGALVAVPGEEG